jgi:hypothetical protein
LDSEQDTETPPDGRAEGRRRRPVEIALLALMTALSLFLWVGVPWGWMRIAGLVTFDSQSFYLLLLVVVPATMIAVGWVLYRVNRVYVRISGEVQPREHKPWLESQAADRVSKRPSRAIDVIMAFSVTVAMIAFVIWFFFLAGSPLPPAG